MQNSGEILKSWVRTIIFMAMTGFWLWMLSEGREAALSVYFWSIYGAVGAPLIGERILKQVKSGLSSVKIVKTNG